MNNIKNNFEYLIIGQGLAGSILGFQLLERGKSVLILNDESLPTSSAVAGGIYNPITGKDLSKTWMADDIFPFMETFYHKIEQFFHFNFVFKSNVYRPFSNENQKQQFIDLRLKQNIENYIDIIENIDSEKKNSHRNSKIFSPLGGMLTHNSGWVDVPLLLSFLRKYFIEKHAYLPEKFDLKNLQTTDNQLFYKFFTAKKIIFCQGSYETQNPVFDWLRFNPVKGETLVATIENYDLKEIINQGAWILPIQENLCRFGASYTWKPLDWLPSQDEKELLLSKIDKFLIPSYKIIDHKAGIRPATQDRRPFLGNHPAHSNVYVFNGFGAKGVSLIPYFANQMVDFMENQKLLTPELNIERYYSLYSLKNSF